MRPRGGPHPQASPVQPSPARPLRGRPCRNPAALTHDGQGGGLAQLAPHGVDDLQPTPVQVAAADGVVARADPVELAFREVDGQAWKRWVSLPGSLAPGPEDVWSWGRMVRTRTKLGVRETKGQSRDPEGLLSEELGKSCSAGKASSYPQGPSGH